jgi:hypothetical protein
MSFPVTGVVQDQSGAIIRDAPVELATASGLVEQTTHTDASGGFRFDAVRAGTYELRVRVEGFKPEVLHVRVASRAPSSQKVVLQIANVTQEITVTNGAGLTTAGDDNRDAITIDPNALENLPIFDQDVIGMASRFLDQGALGTGGVTLIVDGMEAANAGVSASAIEQIKINNDPYSAEYARPGRGRIEIITKAGTQEYHGTLNATLRDSRSNARDPFAATKPSEQRRIFEGSASGPLFGGKTTSFLASADRREEDLQAVVFALDPAGLVQANVPQPRRGIQASVSMNHQQGAHNTMSLRYTHEGGSTRNQGVGGTTLQSAGSDASSYENQVVYGHRTIFTNKLLNEFRAAVGSEGGSTTSLNPAQRIVVLDAFTGGGAQSDRSQRQDRLNLTDTVTYTFGKNLLKAGLNLPEWGRRQSNDLTNSGGTFTFSTIEDYQLGRPFSFVEQRGDGRLAFWDKNLGLFIQEQMQARPDLSVSLGLRYDWQNHIVDNNNFASRASFAYAPGARRGTVVRGGAGVFYDRVEGGPIAELLRSSEGRLVRYVALDPGFPDAFGSGTITFPPPSIVQLAPGVTIPYTVQYGIGIERQLRRSTTVAVTYVGSRGLGVFRSRDINAPPPPLYLARPNPDYGVIRQIERTGRQQTNSIQMTLRGNVTRFFDGSVQYALAQAKNDTNGINSLPANNYDLSSEWGRADFDQRHRFDLVGRISIGRLTNVGIAVSLYSGRPYSRLSGRDNFNTGQTNARSDGAPRNTLEGPGFADVDLRWSHDFPFAPKKKNKGPAATVAVDAFNVLNHVNYVSYVGNVSSPFFGRAVAAQPPRRVQFSLRFKF